MSHGLQVRWRSLGKRKVLVPKILFGSLTQLFAQGEQDTKLYTQNTYMALRIADAGQAVHQHTAADRRESMACRGRYCRAC